MPNFKEKIARGVSAAVLLGSGLGYGACANPSIPQPTEHSITQTTVENSWRMMTPLERVKKLENETYPTEVDLNTELSLAVAQFYCGQTKCNASPEQMAKSVNYLNEDEFIAKLEAENRRKFSEEEVNKEKNSRLAITSDDKTHIYINSAYLDNFIRYIYRTEPELAKKGINYLSTVVKKSILLHEYTHLNSIPQVEEFSAFSLRPPKVDQSINFGRVDDFRIVGEGSTDGKEYYIMGGSESITEKASRTIAKELGVYISPKKYALGAELVNLLNKKYNISDEEFLKYVNGQLPSKILLEKWGKGDLKKGVMLLNVVGLGLEEIISENEAQKYINES